MTAYAVERQIDKLARFDSMVAFDRNFEQMALDVKPLMTKAEYMAFKQLKNYARNLCGVAYCKIGTAVKSTHDRNFIGISRSTFNRMISKAKKLNAISVINYWHANGRRAHSVYVFNKFTDLTLPVKETKPTNKVVRIVSISDTIETLYDEQLTQHKSNNLNKITRLKDKKNTYATQTESVIKQLDSAILKTKEQTPYQQLANYVMQFIADKKLVSRLYGIYRAHTLKLVKSPDIDIAIEAFKHTVKAMRNKSLKSITGYYNNTLSNLIDKHYEDQVLAAMAEQDVNTDIVLFDQDVNTTVPQDLLDLWRLS